jgi:hypothetical protein
MLRSLLLIAILGLTAAFLKPAVPVQAVQEAKKTSAVVSSFDEGLDNDEIVNDSNIHPARKCGFCMG